MSKFRRIVFVSVSVLFVMGIAISAMALSGAIFTTTVNGSEVNANIYASKADVYLDGGPGNGAPVGAAGLPDGTYVFQVTDPNGKNLLSTDPAKCRQFVVSGGIITGVVVTGCQHGTGVDVNHGAATVQLIPYLDTPNKGNEYKVWVTPVADYLNGCSGLGVSNGLSVVDCGFSAGDDHGFVPRNSKTDNFKVGPTNNIEIDTRFFDEVGNLIDGLVLAWTDTLGVTNQKYSYSNPAIGVTDFAHVEAVEPGTHQITVASQAGCAVYKFFSDSITINGPGTIDVFVKQTDPVWTKYLYVYCTTK
jgi:hypothetical protein